MSSYRSVYCDECGRFLGYADENCNDGYAVLMICQTCYDKLELEEEK